MLRRLMKALDALWARIECKAGIHGPIWFGNDSHVRSACTAPFQRTCGCCGAVWHGDAVVRNNMRTLGGWEQVK